MKKIPIKNVEGFKLGNAQDIAGGTGCTTIICEKGAISGYDFRGGAPASHETELLKSENINNGIHGVVLSGGSAYGLESVSGAMEYLEEKNIGFNVDGGVVPIVCGASLFDLSVGDFKTRPNKSMGYKACKNAEKNSNLNKDLETGNFGAGCGASVGKLYGIETGMKSGLGTYGLELGKLQIGAIVATNALGDVVNPDTKEIIAGLLNKNKTSFLNTEKEICNNYKNINIFSNNNLNNTNTTIATIITNGKITKPQANKLASITHNGLDRAIRPVHTNFDGDGIFVLSTNEIECNLTALGVLASEVISRAIFNSVLSAKSSYGLKSAQEFY